MTEIDQWGMTLRHVEFVFIPYVDMGPSMTKITVSAFSSEHAPDAQFNFKI